MTGSRSEIRRDCVQRPFDAAARVIELEAEAEELKKRPDYIEMAKKIRYFKDRVEELEGVNSYGRACIVNDRLRTNLAEAVQLFEVIGFSPEHDPQQCDLDCKLGGEPDIEITESDEPWSWYCTLS